MPTTAIKSLEELRAFASRFLVQNPKGAIVALSGELGAGKTTFVRAVIELIAISEKKEIPRVASPSFVLHQSYSQFKRTIDHFDLYRLEEVTREGLLEIGYFEAWQHAKEKGGFVFVEWPEKAVDQRQLQLDRHLKITLGEETSARFLEWLC